MLRHILQGDGRARATASIAVAAALVVALVGCAAGPGRSPGSAAAQEAPYVGVFTGEYVDGVPLYRFPPIHVVGSRGSLTGLGVDGALP